MVNQSSLEFHDELSPSDWAFAKLTDCLLHSSARGRTRTWRNWLKHEVMRRPNRAASDYLVSQTRSRRDCLYCTVGVAVPFR